MFGEVVDPSVYYKLFANKSGLVDGSAFCIVLNGSGPSINGYPDKMEDPGDGAELVLVNLKKKKKIFSLCNPCRNTLNVYKKNYNKLKSSIFTKINIY